MDKEECDMSERSLLNEGPEAVLETKGDFSFYKVLLQDAASESPPDYADSLHNQRRPRKRERLAFRLDLIADWVWDTSANILQLRTTGEGWTAETCSYVFAVLSLLGLVATLFAHQNKPLPEWPQLITINSIVSLFSLLMRAGVGLILAEGISQSKWQWFRKAHKLNDMERFDAASRGAWGSMSFLFHVSLQAVSCIAALGAMVTILAALNGFFLQQLVVFQHCLQQSPTATVRISKTNYAKAAYQGSGFSYYDPYPPMVVAINSGLVQSVPDHTSAVSHGCVSGNCTFPSDDGMSFSTVAVGHSCDNVTGDIRGSLQSNASMIVTLPTGNDSRIEICSSCDDPKVVIATSANIASYNNSDTVATIWFLYRTSTDSSVWQATNCSLYPTVRTYAVNITNSFMNETLVESTQIPSRIQPQGQYLPYSHRLVTNRTLRNGIWEDCVETRGPDPRAEGLIDIDRNNISTIKYYPADCVWRFSKSTAGDILTYLTELFDQEKLYWSQNVTIEQDQFGNNITKVSATRRKGPTHFRQLYSNGTLDQQKIDDVFQNVTSAITTIIRTYKTEGPEWDAKGNMLTATTCIRVKWRWISFPAIMIGLTGAFLVLVIIDNCDVERERLWKSSVLATLFCEVDQGMGENAHLVSKRAMHDIAKSTSVSLEAKKGTLRLLAR